jgi:hypothetical protein
VKAVGEVESNRNENDHNQEKRIVHVSFLVSVESSHHGRKSQLVVIYFRFHLPITLTASEVDVASITAKFSPDSPRMRRSPGRRDQSNTEATH